MGVRVDYLSVILYLVDLFWLGLVISSLWGRDKKRRKVKIDFFKIIIGCFILFNILVAENYGVAVYRWLRLFQWWWFYEYCKSNKAIVLQYLKGIIPYWVIAESLLGLAQMAKGGSLNGLMYWFGERRFSFTTIGIAQMSVLGQGLIRSYGTFSHPNSMAGFLLVSLGLWVKYYKDFKLNKMWWWVVVWLAVMGMILSGSRIVWALMVVTMIVSFVRVFKKKLGWSKLVGYLAVIGGLFLIVVGLVGVNYRTSDFVGGWDSDSLSKRVSLNIAAVKMWRENFMLGVGAGNFIPKLPEYQSDNKFYWLQPVHNMFLLLGTEIGMLGIIITVWVFKDIWSNKNFRKMGLIWGLIIITGMMDHYWITLPQNSWLLAIVLGAF